MDPTILNLFGRKSVYKTFRKSLIKNAAQASQKKAFTERNIPLLVTVFSLEKKLLNHDPILINIRGVFGRKDAERVGFCYRSL